MTSSKLLLISATIALVGFSCNKEGTSLYDPNYEPSRPDPVISSISPASGYIAGVDSIIVTGLNFSTDQDETLIDFGGSPGQILSATETELVVRPGLTVGDNVPVRVSVRFAEFFSNTIEYKLEAAFQYVNGFSASYSPISAIAVDVNDNIYGIIETGGVTRYRKIAPDGTVSIDNLNAPGDTDGNNQPLPAAQTMRFTEYASMTSIGNDVLLMTNRNLRAIFQKTFGDNAREGVWAASSVSAAAFADKVVDDKGFLWVVGNNVNIHRFDLDTKAESLFPFTANLTSVAIGENKLFVGGRVNEVSQIWSFDVDASGNLSNGSLFYDISANFNNANIQNIILDANQNVFVATNNPLNNIIRVGPDGSAEVYYPNRISNGIYDLEWGSGKFLITAGKNTSGDFTPGIGLVNTYDRERFGLFEN